jgi:negative elongation factor B
LKELRDKLVAHINEIGAKEGRERDKILKELLSKSFSLVRLKALRPIIMCILRNTTHIDDKYLKVLVSLILII